MPVMCCGWVSCVLWVCVVVVVVLFKVVAVVVHWRYVVLGDVRLQC